MKAIIPFLFFLASCSKVTEPISSFSEKREILNKIEKGTLTNIIKEAIFPQIIDSPSFVLDRYVNREKTTYPKFDIDLLFSNVIMTEKNRYIVLIDLQKDSENFRKCILLSTPFDNYNQEYICKSKASECLLGKTLDDIKGYEKCYSSQECKKVKNNNLEVIDKKYCEKLYGRPL